MSEFDFKLPLCEICPSIWLFGFFSLKEVSLKFILMLFVSSKNLTFSDCFESFIWSFFSVDWVSCHSSNSYLSSIRDARIWSKSCTLTFLILKVLMNKYIHSSMNIILIIKSMIIHIMINVGCPSFLLSWLNIIPQNRVIVPADTAFISIKLCLLSSYGSIFTWMWIRITIITMEINAL